MPKHTLFTHFYNEELLLETFLKHHLKIFDHGVMVDHHSTDNSREIIRQLAPGWEIRDTKLPLFNAEDTDHEMEEIEQSIKSDFFTVLNVTELIWNYNWRELLETYKLNNPHIEAFGAKSYCLVDKDLNIPLVHPLWKNRTFGTIDKNFGTNVSRHWRFTHTSPTGGQYGVGRHATSLPSMTCDDLFLLHFTFSPWPQALGRKMQIQGRMPDSDKHQGRGVQHIKSLEQMNDMYQDWLKNSYDLLTDPNFRLHYEKQIELHEKDT